jgi:hypothetical protein
VRKTIAARALGVTVCASLILALVACGGGGGGSSYTGGNSGGSGSGGGGGVTTPPPQLVINSSTLPSGLVGVPYTQTLSASGGTPPYSWSQLYGLPSGFSLSSDGTLTVASPQLGNFGMTVQVTDSGSPKQTSVQQMSLGFFPKLVINTTSLPNAHLGAPYQQLLVADGIVNWGSWQVVTGALPPGLQLGAPMWQGVITGTPTQTGTYGFTVQVQDYSTPPQVAQQSLNLVVDNGLAVVTRNLGSGLQNANYSATVTAVGGTPPYQWSAGGLPPSLTIDPASGTISGVPTLYGVFQPTVTVTDSASHAASQVLGLTVTAALFVYDFGNVSAVINKPFYDHLTAYSGSPPYSWSLASGSMPPGLTLDGAHGTIIGTPTQLGSYNLTFQVTDAGTPQQSAQGSMTISVVPPQLYLASPLPPKLPLGVPVQWTAAAAGGTPPYHWSAATSTLPPGLSFDPNTADLAGTPTSLGQYTFTLSVTDSGSPSQTVSGSYTVNITTPLGRNDTIAHATPLGDGSWQASISPYADPPDSSSPAPDTDYYKIIGSAGSTVKIWTSARANSLKINPLDTVLEIVDANGVRFNSCQQPGDTSNTFNSICLNDDIVKGVNQDSQLEIKVPGAANTQTTMYAHVLDWRGDARPDMIYGLDISGSITPLHLSLPYSTIYGSGSTAPAACPVAVSCSAQFTATGGIQPLAWSVRSGSPPPGMSLDPSTGLLSGTPTTTGAYNFVVSVSDAGTPPQSVTASYTLTIGTMPTLITTSLPDAFTGQPYSFQLTEVGGTPPVRWEMSDDDYQLNMQVDPLTGVLSGVPRASNTDTLNIFIYDSLGLGGWGHVTLTIQPGPFQFPNGSFPNGKVGGLYADSTAYWNIVGGLPPYSVSLLSGTVPPGLTFHGGGLNGTPTTPGTYTMTLQATDSSSTPQTLTATYTITINP